jgi:hypothetical protein
MIAQLQGGVEEEVTTGGSTVEVEVEAATTQGHRERMLLFLKTVK